MESCSKPSDDVKKSGKKRIYREFRSPIREIEELEAQLEAITKVDGWQIERQKLLEAEKSALEKTLEEERQLFADMSDHILHQNTTLQHWMILLKSRRMASVQQAAMASAPSGSELERALDGMREQLKLRSDERKARCEKLEEESAMRSELQSAESSRLEELNIQLVGNLTKRIRDRHCLSERDEEIRKLKSIVDAHNKAIKRTKVMECIVCMDQFGAEPDRQRAHWKECNHANVCYKCTLTLWSSATPKCPSCNTAASSKPGRLPPIIYL